ncbi:hypothetical protein D3C73_1571110 [compost metagenome]
MAQQDNAAHTLLLGEVDRGIDACVDPLGIGLESLLAGFGERAIRNIPFAAGHLFDGRRRTGVLVLCLGSGGGWRGLDDT